MLRRIAVWLVTLFLILPGAVYALGLGQIQIKSGLGQPLQAEIPLLSVKQTDIENLRVGLAPNEVFVRAGMERTLFLTLMQFKIEKQGEGWLIKLTTERPVQDPFLAFVVELNWPNGRMMREFTLLVDPPGIAKAPTQPLPTRATAPARSAGRIAQAQPEASTARPAVGRTGQQQFTARPTQGAAGGSTAASAPRRAPARVGTNYGPVRRGQTLYQIAQEVRQGDPAAASLEQVMMALYRVNPEAFAKENINALSAGKVLRIPTGEEIAQLSAEEARAQARAHTQAWRRGGAVSPTTGQVAARRPATPASDTATPSPTARAQSGVAAPEEGRLQVVAPTDTGGAKSAQASDQSKADPLAPVVSQLQSELALAKEETETVKAERDEQGERVRALEDRLKVLERLVTLKDQELAKLQEQGATLPPAETQLPEESTQAAPTDASDDVSGQEQETADSVSSEAEQKPVETVPTVQTPETEEEQPGFLFNDPKIWAMGGGLLLLILVLIWFIVRSLLRHGDEEEDETELDENESYVSTTVITSIEPDDEPHSEIPSLDTTEADSKKEAEDTAEFDFELSDDEILPERHERVESDEEIGFSQSETVETSSGSAPDTSSGSVADILDEAQVYIAYGRNEQALDFLVKATPDYPDNVELRLTLARVCEKCGRTDLFLEQAEAINKLVTDAKGEVWTEMASIGARLAPENALFSKSDAQMDVQIAEETQTEESQQNAGESDLEPISTYDMPEETMVESEEISLEFDLVDEGLDSEERAASNEFELHDEGTSETELSDIQFEMPDETLPEKELPQEDVSNVVEFTAASRKADLESDIESVEISSDLNDFSEDMMDADLLLDDEDEISTKLDLAQAYIDMGDTEGALGILREVVEEGSPSQIAEAEKLIASLEDV
jgi:pilus assembly protein FimV